MSAQIVYGWLHGGNNHQLYVWEGIGAHGLNTWGVTEKIEEAKPFASVQACKEHYLGKHAFPEQYEQFTRDGYLKYFDLTTKQTILF